MIHCGIFVSRLQRPSPNRPLSAPSGNPPANACNPSMRRVINSHWDSTKLWHFSHRAGTVLQFLHYISKNEIQFKTHCLFFTADFCFTRLKRNQANFITLNKLKAFLLVMLLYVIQYFTRISSKSVYYADSNSFDIIYIGLITLIRFRFHGNPIDWGTCCNTAFHLTRKVIRTIRRAAYTSVIVEGCPP